MLYFTPYKSLKRPQSVWSKSFRLRRAYPIISTEYLGEERVYVLATGEQPDEYQVVYPDEGVIKHEKNIENYLTGR